MGKEEKTIKLADITNKNCCQTKNHLKKETCVQSLRPFHFKDSNTDFDNFGLSYNAENIPDNLIDESEHKKENIKRILNDFAASFDLDECE